MTDDPSFWFDEHGNPFQFGLHYFVGGTTRMHGASF